MRICDRTLHKNSEKTKCKSSDMLSPHANWILIESDTLTHSLRSHGEGNNMMFCRETKEIEPSSILSIRQCCPIIIKKEAMYGSFLEIDWNAEKSQVKGERKGVSYFSS